MQPAALTQQQERRSTSDQFHFFFIKWMPIINSRLVLCPSISPCLQLILAASYDAAHNSFLLLILSPCPLLHISSSCCCCCSRADQYLSSRLFGHMIANCIRAFTVELLVSENIAGCLQNKPKRKNCVSSSAPLFALLCTSQHIFTTA